MKRLILAIIAFLFTALGARAQSGFTQAHAIVLDPTGQPYTNCSGNASFVPSPSATQVPTIGGSTFPTTAVIASCDSFGAFSLKLADNNVVVDGHTSPPASQWRFNILAQGGTPGFACTMTITGPAEDISAQIQACAAPLPAQGGGNVFAFTVVPQSATPSFVGNQDTAFSFLLNQNVTSSTFITNAKAGTSPVYYVNPCQDAVGNRFMTWPSNVTLPANYVFKPTALACSPTAFVYNPNTAQWTPWQDLNTSGSSSGIALQTNGSGNTNQSILNLKNGTAISLSAGAAGDVTINSTNGSTGTQGTLQCSNTAGAFQTCNLSESGGVLTNGDDNLNRGPNPNGVDVRSFGVVAVNPNAIPAPTCTISSGSNSASCSSSAGLAKTNGFAITGAGASQSMTTPVAPIVTPVCAAGPLYTGFVVPAGAAATTRSYQIAMRDVGQGLTAASSAGVTTTGNATPGAHSTALTTTVPGVANTYTSTVASSAELAPGCMIILNGSTDDAEYGGWKIVASVPDGTHITWVSGMNFALGLTASSATGGNVRYFLGDHLALPTPGTGGLQYEMYLAGTKVGESLIASLGYPDTTYNTWDYWGSTISGNFLNNWWAPTTAPVSPINDTLVTTITNIAGTTLTLADNAGTSVTTSASRFDNVPGIKACFAAVNSSSLTGAGGTCRFPVVVENSVTGSYCYVTSTFLDATGVNSVIQDGTVCLGDTMKWGGTWTGTELSAKRLITPSFGIRAHIPIFIFGANPGIWITGNGGLSKVFVDVFGNGEVGVFNTNSNAAQIFEDDSFASGTANDYLNVMFYDYQSSAAGGFGMKIRNSSFIADSNLGGGQATVGQTATPVFISKFNTLLNLDYISGSTRGFSITPHSSGLSGRYIMGEEFQGNIMPLVTFQPYYAGNTAGFYALMDLFNDTGPAPMIAYLPTLTASLGATIQINGSNLPSSGNPLVSGSPFAALQLNNINATSSLQLGQNMNTTSIGQSNGSLPGIRTTSLALAAINYTGNHTLTKAESIVNAQATLTFTIDTTLGDGQSYDVYSETGTTTLTVSAGTLHGNAATGNITIPNNSGMHVFLKGGNAYAYGLGGGIGGGCTPGGLTDALLYNGGTGTCAGVNSPTANGNYNVHYRVTSSAAVPPAIDLPGIPVNAQTGATYTIGTANTDFDRGYLITANNAGAQTYTFVNPSTTGYGFNHFFVIKNIGTGTVTATSSGFKINGSDPASLLIAPSWTVFFWSNGVDYFASRLPDFGAFPNCVGGGNALQFTTATGVFSCGASSAGVASITGDGIIFNNSASTGAVTLTLANAAAHKFLMNNTGGSAAPGYQSPGKSDLLATIVYNDQGNAYGAFNQDFSLATWKWPTAAGFTASATSMSGYDSTAKIPHCYVNDADGLCATTTATSTTVTQVLHATATAGIYAPGAIVTADLPAQYTKGSCTEAWGGSGTSFAMTAGDDAISNNTCYNDSGVTRTITAVKCRSDNAANTTVLTPTFGSSGTGTAILTGTLTCGNSYAYSSSGTVTNASWTTGTGIDPGMSTVGNATSISMIVEYTF